MGELPDRAEGEAEGPCEILKNPPNRPTHPPTAQTDQSMVEAMGHWPVKSRVSQWQSCADRASLQLPAALLELHDESWH